MVDIRFFRSRVSRTPWPSDACARDRCPPATGLVPTGQDRWRSTSPPREIFPAPGACTINKNHCGPTTAVSPWCVTSRRKQKGAPTGDPARSRAKQALTIHRWPSSCPPVRCKRRPGHYPRGRSQPGEQLVHKQFSKPPGEAHRGARLQRHLHRLGGASGIIIIYGVEAGGTERTRNQPVGGGARQAADGDRDRGSGIKGRWTAGYRYRGGAVAATARCATAWRRCLPVRRTPAPSARNAGSAQRSPPIRRLSVWGLASIWFRSCASSSFL